ncbi:MAG TPA: PhzF family phenazine biosynthesis protein [Pyrinomonadaceae bacterium]|jgi:PhzF family phenazine biosynthesis protein
MKIPFYQIDAFTERAFGGNPAGVCPLESWLPDETMQSIALENNLSETAFFVRRGEEFDLRWFTPTVEVNLCGHATLASGFVLYRFLGYTQASIRFQTKSGLLTVEREGDLLAMNFPAWPPQACDAPRELLEGLGKEPREVLRTRDYVAVYDSESDIRALAPEMELLKGLDALGIIATAPGDEVDFVSRFFAPGAGIPEDPVTGSAHCSLTPLWAERLSKTRLRARQLSPRGGEIFCEHLGDRVKVAGRAVPFLTGEISLNSMTSDK